MKKMRGAKEVEYMKQIVKKAGAVIATFAIAIAYMKLIGCPIRRITGIPCAGCGMTRAWLAVLRLDFQKAYYYHPLYPLPLLGFLLLLEKKRINPIFYKTMLYGMAILFVGVYIDRLIKKDDVLVIDIQKSIIFQIISCLRGG